MNDFNIKCNNASYLKLESPVYGPKLVQAHWVLFVKMW